MSSPQQRLAAAVEAMLRNRRPRPYDAGEDAAALQAAAALRAARPGADLPTEEFIAALEGKLRGELDGAEPRSERRLSRRAFLRGTGIAAAAAAAGVAADRIVEHTRGGGGAGSAAELVPDAGRWVPVADVAELPAGSARRFSAGAVEGVLVGMGGGGVAAVSAVCTHLGCLLSLDQSRRRLDCPCHGASFTVDGTPVDGYVGELRPLSHLRSRVRGSAVEVFVA